VFGVLQCRHSYINAQHNGGSLFSASCSKHLLQYGVACQPMQQNMCAAVPVEICKGPACQTHNNSYGSHMHAAFSV
jgi:hypothetical protein